MVGLCSRPPDQEEADDAKKWKKPHAYRPSRVSTEATPSTANEAAEHIDTCHEMLLVDPSLALSTLKGGSHPLHKHSAVFQRVVCATCIARTSSAVSKRVSLLSYILPGCSAAESKFLASLALSC